MKGALGQVHAMGLKLGIYSSPWIGTYAAHIGSYSDNPDGENQWIKDGNHNENFRYEKPGGNYWQDRKGDVPPRRLLLRQGRRTPVGRLADRLPQIRLESQRSLPRKGDARRASRNGSRHRIQHLQLGTYADAPLWVEYTDCWRTTGDIRDMESISSIGFEQQRWAPFCGPGHWPDADMLVVGLVGWGPKLHYTKLTADEQYTHTFKSNRQGMKKK